jgi:uncharacterized membrane protein YphA (DoxX/SURF4 family)
MENIQESFNRVDVRITSFLAKYSITILRVSLGINFLWFGALKLIPGLSPAEGLATNTIEILTFGLIQPEVSIIILAVWEVLIGIGLITGWFLRITLFLLLGQMIGAMTPLLLFPTETFTHFPYAPTLEGQYIIKNLVLISAGMVVGATVRGGRIVEEDATDLSKP